MDTAKPLNPSSKADAADDLIEELARLMADDAQINSPPPQTAPKNAGVPETVGGQGGVPTSPPPPSPAPTQAPTSANAATTPGFDLKNFDLGAPKAEVTQLTGEKTASNSSQQGTSQNPSQGQNNSPGESSNEKLDFDFGFGVGPDSADAPAATPTNHAKAPIAPEPTSSAPAPAPIDPIADLINAAVSKHSTNETQIAEPEPAPVPQTDSFTTPPVFGLSGTSNAQGSQTPGDVSAPQAVPEPEKPLGGSMALNEIETLIGNSVKVDAASQNAAQNNAPQAAPSGDLNAQQAVEGPSLSSSPTADPIVSQASPAADTAPESAEAAILQAMAAAGTATRQTNFDTSHQTQNEPELAPAPLPVAEENEPTLAAGRVKHANSNDKDMKRYLVPALGLLFVGAIGFGAYSLFNTGPGEGDVPVLTADATPTRVEPAPVEEPSQSVVLNEIDGTSTDAQNEQLVSRDETDGATGTTVRQVITADNSDAGLANRRVRTVTVRPDGTIISGDDAVAGGEVLPVAQPNLPELPADAINTTLSNTTVAALPDASALAPTALSVPVTPNLFAVNGDSVPFPKARLTNRAALAASALTAQTQLPQTSGVTQTASSGSNATVDLIAQTASDAVAATTPTPPQPIPDTTPVATTPQASVANPQAYVQLASQRSQSVANQTAATLQSRYSSALGGASLVVRRVDLGTRGVYFRVQLPTSTISSANSICNAVKNAGGDCFTRSN